MTAYSLTPVHAQDREHGVVVDLPSRAELLAENERLRQEVADWRRAWQNAANGRVATSSRLSKAMRVLASLGRLSPRMAALVERARAEVYGELP